MKNHKFDYSLKINIVGRPFVGKARLITRFVDNTFLDKPFDIFIEL